MTVRFYKSQRNLLYYFGRLDTVVSSVSESPVRYLYAVIAQQLFRLTRARGFPCNPVGAFTDMPGGVTAVAVIMDWRDFEKRNALKKRTMLAWFNRAQSDRDRPLLPRLDICSPRQ